MNKFLVLGTGDDINNINFDKIDNDYIIAGVNRIYEKIIPDYYFVYDVKELMPIISDDIKLIYTHPAKLAEYYRERNDYTKSFHTYYDPEYTPGFKMDGKHYDCGHGSINYLLRLLNNYLFNGQENVFYLAGVPLLEGKGHFYGKRENETTLQSALNRFYNDFLRLKKFGYNIVSLMQESKLNELFPTEDLNIIYKDVNNG